ncbi:MULTISPECIES: hypothetical protein [Sporosarcina]|uniref:hypothetical protein n=1 Tax=Sporosarcina TaxID=1569 RepID=UPI00129AED97|nr:MULTISPECIES: hypothetical protein [Sporosarcina]GKV66691.1 hypothetical protein NCCP2331_28440 [Sporosarcina sp. NCCP-2331]GLB57002.1 hypothetical protein NCCP2378_27890 [Sporosarcina sp. NCCP-2378]
MGYRFGARQQAKGALPGGFGSLPAFIRALRRIIGAFIRFNMAAELVGDHEKSVCAHGWGCVIIQPGQRLMRTVGVIISVAQALIQPSFAIIAAGLL